jgi:hypothetical protein
MARPTPPAEAEAGERRRRNTLQRAANTAAALDLVALHHERPRAELRRLLSRRDLEHEAAAVLIRCARREAARLVAADDEPPPADDAYSAAVALLHARIRAERDRQLDEEADRALAAQLDA